jgi:hypothetical protein
MRRITVILWMCVSVAAFAQGQAPPRPSVSPHPARVEPGQTVTFSTEVENAFSSIPGSPHTVRFTATNSTIEDVAPHDLWECSITSPAEAVCTARPLTPERRLQPIRVKVRPNPDPAGGAARVDVRAMGGVPDPSPHEPVQFLIEIYRMIGVTSAADAGAGSLRAAIGDANGHCTPGPCKIVFRIPGPVPNEGWFTILPSEPLPAITAERVIVDAETQTAFTGDTNPRGPEVAIDGRVSRAGLVIDGPCDAGVRGLAIGNFSDGFGLSLTDSLRCFHSGRHKFDLDSIHVSRNHLGIDPSGTIAWPNLRGLRFDGSRGTVNGNVISGNRASGVWLWSGTMFLVHNRIGVAGDGISAMPNGASGVFVGPGVQNADIFQNIIANHPQMGVAAARGAREVEIRENSMHNNGGLGIDWGLDGVSPQTEDQGSDKPSNPPVLLSAVYDAAADKTLVTMTVNTRSLSPGAGHIVTIDIYSNGTSDGDGESWLFSDFAHEKEGRPLTLAVPGNHTGRWLNATSTRSYQIFSRPPDDKLKARPASLLIGITHTSEFSNSILVGR